MRNIILTIALLIMSAILISAGQSRVITGKVTDDQGQPICGVNVVVKNSKRSTTTDINGEYRITVYSEDRILVFSFIGMNTKEVAIKDKIVIDVVLIAAVYELEENIVIGYGGTHKVKHMETAMPSLTGGGLYYADQSWSMTPDFNTEGYSTVHENGYKEVMNQPLSTFSIDVDRASYANIRRFINMGQLPPKDAVRIEEMINYFSYDYPEPDEKHPFSVYTELSVCPWNKAHQLLHIGLKGKSMDKTELPPSNLVFLIDVSGSMNMPNKLPLVKSSMQMLVKELRSKDKVAIVVYAGAAGLVLESTPGDEKEKIMEAIERLQAGGSTAGGEGLRLAYKVAEENIIKGGNNRIILASDGDFNVGVSSNAEMERLVEEKRQKGVFITVLGYGMGNYKDDKLEIIANKGNGNYAYIDNIQEARKTLVSEFAGSLFTIAKDVKFQIEFNPARVKAYRLIGYENRLLNNEDFNDDKKDAGEMGAGHTVTALYELIPAGSDENAGNVDPLKYQKNPSEIKSDPNKELLTVKLRYKLPDGDTSILIDRPEKGKLLALAETSDNFRFSAAVAGFGMVLRDSEYKGNAGISNIIELAKGARGEDEEGNRNEFLRLVRMAGELKGGDK